MADNITVKDAFGANTVVRAKNNGGVYTEQQGNEAGSQVDGHSATIGSTTDPAVTDSTLTATQMSRIAGLLKILGDAWDSNNHLLRTDGKVTEGLSTGTPTGMPSAWLDSDGQTEHLTGLNHPIPSRPSTPSGTAIFDTNSHPGYVAEVNSRTEQVTFTDRSGSIASGGTAQVLAPAFASRRFLLIQNLHASADLWINFGVTAVADQPSVKIAAGTTFTMPLGGMIVDTEQISVIGGTTGQKWAAKEA